MNRIFRSTDAVLESVRIGLDKTWGYPNTETRTTTSLPVAAECPHDAQGRVYVVVDGVYCDYDAVAAILPQLLAGGQVEELTEAQYRSIFPLPQKPRRNSR